MIKHQAWSLCDYSSERLGDWSQHQTECAHSGRRIASSSRNPHPSRRAVMASNECTWRSLIFLGRANPSCPLQLPILTCLLLDLPESKIIEISHHFNSARQPCAQISPDSPSGFLSSRLLCFGRRSRVVSVSTTTPWNETSARPPCLSKRCRSWCGPVSLATGKTGRAQNGNAAWAGQEPARHWELEAARPRPTRNPEPRFGKVG